MILTCPKCETRLQLDERKTPAHPFTVRCPKCQTSVNVQLNGESSVLPASNKPATASQSAAPNRVAFERPATAARFRAGDEENNDGFAKDASAGLNDLARLLAEALNHSSRQPGKGHKRPAWERRKVLVCAGSAYREAIAASLAQHDYDVFVAENMVQALGRMREERMDVIVLDADFDPQEQGEVFITREVRLLRPSERRRLFLVYLTAGVRTMDLHAAFLQNVNLVVSPSDVDQLADALDVSIRDYNELYRPLNNVLDLASI